jgi:hypothetical protein
LIGPALTIVGERFPCGSCFSKRRNCCLTGLSSGSRMIPWRGPWICFTPICFPILVQLRPFMRRRAGLDGGIVLLPGDIKELSSTIRRKRVRLLILDPIQAHLGGAVDSYKDQSVRSALAPLATLGEKHNCAILILYHLNKGYSTDPMMRAGGSVGIPGISRTCLLLGHVPGYHPNEGRRVVVGFKNNYGPLMEASEYRLDPVWLRNLEQPSIRMNYVSKSTVTPAMLLAGRN